MAGVSLTRTFSRLILSSLPLSLSFFPPHLARLMDGPEERESNAESALSLCSRRFYRAEYSPRNGKGRGRERNKRDRRKRDSKRKRERRVNENEYNEDLKRIKAERRREVGQKEIGERGYLLYTAEDEIRRDKEYLYIYTLHRGNR